MDPSKSEPGQPPRCLFCEWSGGDVVELQTNEGVKPICQSCLVVVNIGVDSLGEAHPGVLVPLIRSCVAQTVGVIMGQFLEKMIQVLSDCAEQGMTLAEKSAVIQQTVASMTNNQKS